MFPKQGEATPKNRTLFTEKEENSLKNRIKLKVMISDNTYQTAHSVSIQKEKDSPVHPHQCCGLHRPECCWDPRVTYGHEQHREAHEEMIQALAQF